MPQIPCEVCGSTKPGGRNAFPDVGLVCDRCFDEGYPKLTREQQLSQPPRGTASPRFDTHGKVIPEKVGG